MFLSKAIEGFMLSLSTDKAAGTIKLRGLYLRIFLNYVGDCDLSTILLPTLQQYISYLRTEYQPHRVVKSNRVNEPLSLAAIDNHWKALRIFFRWCSLNLGTSNPAEKLNRPKYDDPEIIPYTQEEITRLVKVAEHYQVKRNGVIVTCKRPQAKRDRVLLLLLLDTGIRIGELSRLRVEDIHIESGEINIRPFSTGRKTRPRSIPIGKTTKMALWHYLSSLKDLDPANLLLSMTDKAIRETLLKFGKAALVPDCHAHRFRHTFAIEYLRNGGDVFTLQRILGHSTLDMVNRYLHIVKADLVTAHKRASPADNMKL